MIRLNTTFEYPNGATYTGQAIGTKRDGKGVYIHNGITLSGDWENDFLLHGKMECTAFTYEGEFSQNMRHGKGVEVTRDGNRYEGYFANGKKHGKMKITLANGATIDCEFSHGVGVGDGVMTMTDGEKVPVHFKDGNLYFTKD